MSAALIRAATHDDLPAILAIYNDAVLHSTAVWEEKPVALEDRRQWMDERLQNGFPVLVAEEKGGAIAYASYGPWRKNCGYFRTVEHTVHVSPAFRRRGLATALLARLGDIAAEQGRHVMIGGISADNAGSIRLHEKLGFREGGRMHQVGYKFGRWLDLVFMQKLIDG